MSAVETVSANLEPHSHELRGRFGMLRHGHGDNNGFLLPCVSTTALSSCDVTSGTTVCDYC